MNNIIQNKICSLNIILNERIVNNIPILFRIHESGERTTTEILCDHMKEITRIIYDKATMLDDIVNSSVKGIIYDINSEDDKYETYELNIGDMLSYDSEKSRELIEKKINEYAKIVVERILPTEHPKDFIDAYKIINEHNENKISTITFTQYIMSCFNKEYDNVNAKLINHQVENIMNNNLTSK